MIRQRGRLAVFIDGECPLCRVTRNVLAATDRAGATEVASFREDTSYQAHGITDAEATSRLQVIDTTTGDIYAGFHAIQRLAREVPLLLPTRPVLWLLAKLGIGEATYDFIAKHRPTRKECSSLETKG